MVRVDKEFYMFLQEYKKALSHIKKISVVGITRKLKPLMPMPNELRKKFK